MFDTGLINQVLNTIEANGGTFHIVDCQVRANAQDTKGMSSTAIIQVSMESREGLDELIDTLKVLTEDTVGADGTLTEWPDYCAGDYSTTMNESSSSSAAMHDTMDTRQVYDTKDTTNIVCLGAGLVCSPLLEYLSRDPKNHLTVVSAVPNEAEALARRFTRRNVVGRRVDAIGDKAAIDTLCKEADCVVSLLPATMHLDIAQRCIKYQTPLVTASYVSPEMKQLNEEAQKAGISILCEMGLDPGMDHMSAMKVIDHVKEEGGEIVSFSSVCGGLPAPEAADNPLAYKFSWSPRGVLTAAQNDSRYLEHGKVIKVKGKDLLSKATPVTSFLPAYALEVLPNRDALPYAETYGISSATSVFRGTLRYAGWSRIMYQCNQLGLLDATDITTQLPSTWNALMDQLSPPEAPLSIDQKTRDCLNWLGLYSNDPVDVKGSVMDTFCGLLEKKLSYAKGEHDMALMHHSFGVVYPKTGKKQDITSTFVGYGTEDGETMMAKTVGVTAAIGVELMLEGAIKAKGVLTPTTSDIYSPALARLEAEGVKFRERFQDSH